MFEDLQSGRGGTIHMQGWTKIVGRCKQVMKYGLQFVVGPF